MRVKQSLMSIFILFLVMSCSHNERLYRESLEKVKIVAYPGKSITASYYDLKNEGWDVSEPYHPSKFQSGLWMNIHYGYQLGFFDTARHSADIAIEGPPSSILVEADQRGIIQSVR